VRTRHLRAGLWNGVPAGLGGQEVSVLYDQLPHSTKRGLNGAPQANLLRRYLPSQPVSRAANHQNALALLSQLG
jgi:hypothetical protein